MDHRGTQLQDIWRRKLCNGSNLQTDSKSFSLRPYQTAAIDQTLADLEEIDRTGIVLPTGAGKTEIFIELTNKYIESHPNDAVLILSHSDMITTQTIARFGKRAPHLDIGRLQAGEYPDRYDQVTVGTMQSSSNKKHTTILKHILKRNVKLIIVDECHFLFTDSYDKALAEFDAKLVGCTATPWRDRKSMLNFFQRVSFSRSLQEMINDGYLVPPHLIQLERSGNDFSQFVATYLEHEKNVPAAFFVPTKEDCNLVRNLLVEHDVPAAMIIADTSKSKRDELIADFKSGKVKALVTCNVLTAGIDLPNLEVIIMPAVKSPTTYLQRIGRALRLSEGKAEARIYAFGEAPSIAQGFYEKIEKQALAMGGKPVDFETHAEDLEFNDYKTAEMDEVYHWKSDVVDCIRHMERVGMTTLAEMLNHKKFPPKFLKDIVKFKGALPQSKGEIPGGKKPATDKQLIFLCKNGFTEERLSKLTKGEANKMISVILHDAPKDQRWIIKDGKHQGKQIWELPWNYRTYVLKNLPNSKVAKQLREYNNHKKKEKK